MKRRMMVVLFALGAALATAGEAPRREASANELKIPFDRYTTKDAFERTITFYLSPASPSGAETKQPVVLLIQGSGCQSLFKPQGDVIAGGYQNPLRDTAKGRARALVVE